MATVNMLSVSKRYEHDILCDVNLKIERGEFVAVVGPSGCGKSTLLRLVAGLDKVSDGQILINDTCVNDIPPASRDMAMVFQSYALYPHMTAYDNMAYGLKMRGMNKADIKKRVESVAELLQLTDYLYRKPLLLSGGQRQRVAMGRAIVRSPSVFLFDEPLSNLDAKLRTEMRHEIKKLHKTLRTTCLYVTHDQTEAMTMADRVVVLNKGRVEQIGTPRELYEYPETLFVAGFLGHYPMNFLPATVDLTEGCIVTTTGARFPIPSVMSSLATGDKVVVAVRAEHLFMTTDEGRERMLVDVEFIDDMGADKLIQAVTAIGGVRLFVRISGDLSLEASQRMVGLFAHKAHLFCQTTGKRLGGWHE